MKSIEAEAWSVQALEPNHSYASDVNSGEKNVFIVSAEDYLHSDFNAQQHSDTKMN
jgi:hypothetical protein